MPQMSLNDTTVYVGGLAGILVEVGDGNLTYTESRGLKYTTTGLALADVVEEEDKPLELKFDFIWKRATATPIALLERIKGATGLTSSDTAAPCRPYAVDIVIKTETACRLPIAVTSITSVTTTATVTTTDPHKLTTGDTTIIAGATQTEYNGSYVVTVTGASTFTYTFAGSGTSPATGTITAVGGAVYRQITFPDFRYENLDYDLKMGKISASGHCNTLVAGAATII